jgi:hypothetical protein
MTCNKCHGYINTIGCKCEVDELQAKVKELEEQVVHLKSHGCIYVNECYRLKQEGKV